MFGKDKETIIPTGRTVDAEAGEIKLDLGVDHAEPEATSDALGQAIAQHFAIEPDNITAFIVAVEHSGEQGMTLSSAWSLVSPLWRLKGIARELLAHLERQ